jgi:beta-glucosidase
MNRNSLTPDIPAPVPLIKFFLFFLTNLKRIAFLLLPILAGSMSLCHAQEDSTPAYQNTNLPFEERARDLEQRMTLEEKVSQLGHTSDAIQRLGIPEYNWWNEGLHGVARAGIATVFPQAIGLAATFDDALLFQDAAAISTEFRAKYNENKGKDGSTAWYKGLTVWSPNINIFRDPRWGRGQETYGEDPYLTSRMGLAFVKGLQGDDPKYLKIVATPKHFAVHSGPEATRHEVDVPVSAHDMEDTYLPAFRATVMDAGAQSVMCAYNSVNGQPACANKVLLRDHLRGAWKFQGYVVSDCAAIEDISARHKFKPTPEEGVAAAIEAGTDLICGSPNSHRTFSTRLVRCTGAGSLVKSSSGGERHAGASRVGTKDRPRVVGVTEE